MTTPVNTSGFSTNLGLPTLPDIDQYKYPEIFAQFLRIQNAIFVLQASLDAYTGVQGAGANNYGNVASNAYLAIQNLSRFYLPCSENIAAYAAVNFFSNSGTPTARNANATNNTKPCHAFCNVSGGLTAGQTGEFILMGYWPITGVTPGQRYWLSTTNGTIQTTEPAAAGNIGQCLGFGLGTTGIMFNPVQNWNQH